ncbi:MAG: VWA domain-containing protein [Candidatus ainarchaeum sp.]|nr:VWA domain-containing protein [Candidatus ainarchaeum sp.]
MNLKSKKTLAIIIVCIVLILVLSILFLSKNPLLEQNKLDSWFYSSNSNSDFSNVVKGLMNVGSIGAVSQSLSTNDSMGYSVGGAKDISNFRANIENNYFPQPSDLTYEGLFYDYYFDTINTKECNELFCPSYSYALTKDPFSEKDDYYLSVGLNSGMKQSDFERKKLNLVVVLDISGSMGSNFNKYYYDSFGNKIDNNSLDEDKSKSKMQIANESVVELLKQLNDDDRFGMVLFDSSSYLAKPIELVGQTDMVAISNHILEITPRGGTNFEAGLKEATSLFEEYKNNDKTEYENRIIFLTDAMPNVGQIGEDSLLGMTKTNADDGIYITFIGIGVDFQTELIEEITKVRGANYYSVHSSSEFKKRMGDEFDYMVTPLVFNLNLKLESNGFEIQKVYGSPEANESTGEIMKVNTLFPSSSKEEGVKGGVILLKLKKLNDNANLKLNVTYEDRTGQINNTNEEVNLIKVESDYYQNNGIRKAVLLSRYADLLKNWMNDEKGLINEPKTIIVPSVNKEDGIIVPIEYTLNKWEHQSTPLTVSNEYKNLFQEFKTYFENEMDSLNDDMLKQEVKLLNKLI